MNRAIRFLGLVVLLSATVFGVKPAFAVTKQDAPAHKTHKKKPSVHTQKPKPKGKTKRRTPKKGKSATPAEHPAR
ncbi:MAG TPA: hypothetical protein VGI10_20155 [Polyangiaceae bacterium]